MDALDLSINNWVLEYIAAHPDGGVRHGPGSDVIDMRHNICIPGVVEDYTIFVYLTPRLYEKRQYSVLHHVWMRNGQKTIKTVYK